MTITIMIHSGYFSIYYLDLGGSRSLQSRPHSYSYVSAVHNKEMQQDCERTLQRGTIQGDRAPHGTTFGWHESGTFRLHNWAAGQIQEQSAGRGNISQMCRQKIVQEVLCHPVKVDLTRLGTASAWFFGLSVPQEGFPFNVRFREWWFTMILYTNSG